MRILNKPLANMPFRCSRPKLDLSYFSDIPIPHVEVNKTPDLNTWRGVVNEDSKATHAKTEMCRFRKPTA